MKIKRDVLTGAVLILVGAFFAFLTSQFSMDVTPQYPGPKMLPYIACFGMIVCGIGILVEGLMSKKEEKVFMLPSGYVKMLIVFVILCIYVFAMKYLGFLISTPFVLFALSYAFARGEKVKIWHLIVFSIAMTAFTYLMYTVMFGLSLPDFELLYYLE